MLRISKKITLCLSVFVHGKFRGEIFLDHHCKKWGPTAYTVYADSHDYAERRQMDSYCGLVVLFTSIVTAT